MDQEQNVADEGSQQQVLSGAKARPTALEFFAPCPRGLDKVAAYELRSMGLKIRPLQTGVVFYGTLRDAYRVCLYSRIVSRVLLVLARADASSADALYAACLSYPWERHFDADCTIAVDASGTNDALRNTQFTGQKVKDAICDRLRDATGARPDVDKHGADINISVAVRGDKATISLNLSGEALYRRGYEAEGERPSLQASLAAGLLLTAGWGAEGDPSEMAQPTTAAKPGAKGERRGAMLLNPCCGDGMIAIEAAMITRHMAPGLLRGKWGFDAWKLHNAAVWEAMRQEARDLVLPIGECQGRILAYDTDDALLERAREAARRAGVADAVSFAKGDVAQIDSLPGEEGVLALALPITEDMAVRSTLPALYSSLGALMRRGDHGWRAAVYTADPSLDRFLGFRPFAVQEAWSGLNEAAFRVYRLGQETKGATPHVTIGETVIPVFERGSQEFSNRLRRRYAHLRKWAKREDIHAYRVYDADLPDYNVAIDLYEQEGTGELSAVVFEYAAPSTVDAARAEKRLMDVLALTPAALGIPTDRMHFKQRRRGTQGGQKSSGTRSAGTNEAAPGAGQGGGQMVVLEHGHRFEVNLADYLDTGLFLDHRIARGMVEERLTRFQEESGRTPRFLNLFAYTGTATVHAAATGAFTTTVDISNTYIAWARRNLHLNKLGGPKHELVREDCRRWLAEAARGKDRWDLVFVDPPSFSNSKSAGKDWDVQRDHVYLLKDVCRLLTRNGEAIFSCNLRTFKPDYAALEKAGIKLEDISESTIDEDFARNPRIHRCYLVTKTESWKPGRPPRETAGKEAGGFRRGNGGGHSGKPYGGPRNGQGRKPGNRGFHHGPKQTVNENND